MGIFCWFGCCCVFECLTVWHFKSISAYSAILTAALLCKSVPIYHPWWANHEQAHVSMLIWFLINIFKLLCSVILQHLQKYKKIFVTHPCCLFTAFIQSDTILEVLHFGEGNLLQVIAFFFLFAFKIIVLSGQSTDCSHLRKSVW